MNLDGTICWVANPQRSVTLLPNGTYTTCTGETCEANAGLHTGTLAVGTSTTNGAFTCAIRQTGVTCTATRGGGYTISTSGVVSVVTS